jgi:hypothetical protein
MKKVFILLLLCTFTYGDIMGFKLGSPIKDKTKIIKLNIASDKKIGDVVYKIKKVKFFDTGEIEVDTNKTIMSITFIKTYKVNVQNLQVLKRSIKKDLEFILKKIGNKYGVFDKSNAVNYYKEFMGSNTNFYWLNKIKDIWVNKNVNDKNIGEIRIVLISDGQDLKNPENIMEDNEVKIVLSYIRNDLMKSLENKKDNRLNDF